VTVLLVVVLQGEDPRLLRAIITDRRGISIHIGREALVGREARDAIGRGVGRSVRDREARREEEVVGVVGETVRDEMLGGDEEARAIAAIAVMMTGAEVEAVNGVDGADAKEVEGCITGRIGRI